MGVYTDRLAKVRSAIDAILIGGQSVTYENQRVDRANLETLKNLEAEYATKAAAETPNTGCAAKGRNKIIYVTPQL